MGKSFAKFLGKFVGPLRAVYISHNFPLHFFPAVRLQDHAPPPGLRPHLRRDLPHAANRRGPWRSSRRSARTTSSRAWSPSCRSISPPPPRAPASTTRTSRNSPLTCSSGGSSTRARSPTGPTRRESPSPSILHPAKLRALRARLLSHRVHVRHRAAPRPRRPAAGLRDAPLQPACCGLSGASAPHSPSPLPHTAFSLLHTPPPSGSSLLPLACGLAHSLYVHGCVSGRCCTCMCATLSSDIVTVYLSRNFSLRSCG